MAYTKLTWKDAPDTSTPISAENLNHIEDGIQNNSDSIDTLTEKVGNIKDTVKGVINGYGLSLAGGYLMMVPASTSSAGAMTAADKAKLDGLTLDTVSELFIGDDIVDDYSVSAVDLAADFIDGKRVYVFAQWIIDADTILVVLPLMSCNLDTYDIYFAGYAKAGGTRYLLEVEADQEDNWTAKATPIELSVSGTDNAS